MLNQKFKASVFLLLLISQNVIATDFGVVSEDKLAQGNEVSFTSNVDIPVAKDISESARDAVKLSDGSVVVYKKSGQALL